MDMGGQVLLSASPPNESLGKDPASASHLEAYWGQYMYLEHMPAY